MTDIMNNNHYCVIMAGGSASRFWPLTRESRPKQFLNMTGSGRSFLKCAYDRCAGVVPEENIIIITNQRYGDLVREQIPNLAEGNLLLEPYGRKTAPCIAYSTYTILKRDPSAVVAVIPSDLVIEDVPMFKTAISNAFEYAEKNDVLVTLGIAPSGPDTSFGYIQATGGKAALLSDKPVKVKTFTEKPDASMAEVFCKSGEFFWNSGIFVWQASVIREELERYTPEITRLFEGWEYALGSKNEKSFIDIAYTDCTKLSIDNGVMEKTEKAWVYPVKFGWTDVDNWETLYDAYEGKDEKGNMVKSSRPYLENSEGNIIMSGKQGKLIAVNGLKDFIVIDTDDVLLICPRDDKRYKDFVANTAMPGFDDVK